LNNNEKEVIIIIIFIIIITITFFIIITIIIIIIIYFLIHFLTFLKHIIKIGSTIATFFNEVRRQFEFSMRFYVSALKENIEMNKIINDNNLVKEKNNTVQFALSKIKARTKLLNGEINSMNKNKIVIDNNFSADAAAETLAKTGIGIEDLFHLPSYLETVFPFDEWTLEGNKKEIKHNFHIACRYLRNFFYLSHPIIAQAAGGSWNAIREIDFICFMYIPLPFERPHNPDILLPIPSVKTVSQMLDEDYKRRDAEKRKNQEDELKLGTRTKEKYFLAPPLNKLDNNLNSEIGNDKNLSNQDAVSQLKDLIINEVTSEDTASNNLNRDSELKPGDLENILNKDNSEEKYSSKVITRQLFDTAKSKKKNNLLDMDPRYIVSQSIPLSLPSYSACLQAVVDLTTNHYNIIILEKLSTVVMSTYEKMKDLDDLNKNKNLLIKFISTTNFQLEESISRMILESFDAFLRMIRNFGDAVKSDLLEKLEEHQCISAEERNIERKIQKDLEKKHELEMKKRQKLNPLLAFSRNNSSDSENSKFKSQGKYVKEMPTYKNAIANIIFSTQMLTNFRKFKEKIIPSSSTEGDVILYHGLNSRLSLSDVVEMVTSCNTKFPPLFIIIVKMLKSGFYFDPPLSSFRESSLGIIEKILSVSQNLPIFEFPFLMNTKKKSLNIFIEKNNIEVFSAQLSDCFIKLERPCLALIGSLWRYSQYITITTDEYKERMCERLSLFFVHVLKKKREEKGEKTQKRQKKSNLVNYSYTSSDLKNDVYSNNPELSYSINLLNKSSVFQNSSASIFSEEIEYLDNIMEDFSLNIPPFIAIGIFCVDFRQARQSFLNTLNLLKTSLLQFLSSECTCLCNIIIDEYQGYEDELSVQLTETEQLFSLNARVDFIINRITETEKQISSLESCFSVLESFHFLFDSSDVEVRWKCAAAPSRLDEIIQGLPKILKQFRQNIIIQLQQNQRNLKIHIRGLIEESRKYDNIDDYDKFEIYAQETGMLNMQILKAKELADKYTREEAMLKLQIHSHPEIEELCTSFEPIFSMWKTINEWSKYFFNWSNMPFNEIDAYGIAFVTNSISQEFSRILNSLVDNENRILLIELVAEVKSQVDIFLTRIPMILKMANSSMKTRHWGRIGKEIVKDKMKGHNPAHQPIDQNLATISPTECTLGNFLELKLEKYPTVLTILGDAQAEYTIETSLDRMNNEMNQLSFEISPYKTSQTYIIPSMDNVVSLIDQHRAATNSFFSSPHISQFEERCRSWLELLDNISGILSVWTECQNLWMFYSPIFQSLDISQRRPQESRKFLAVDTAWKKVMSGARNNSHVLAICGAQGTSKVGATLTECISMMQSIKGGLSKYLDGKRSGFPRLFFVSDDELLDLISSSKALGNFERIPHIQNIFHYIHFVEVLPKTGIISVKCPEGEQLLLDKEVVIEGIELEIWLQQFLDGIKNSLKKQTITAMNLINYELKLGLNFSPLNSSALNKEENSFFMPYGQLYLEDNKDGKTKEEYLNEPVNQKKQRKQFFSFSFSPLGVFDFARLSKLFMIKEDYYCSIHNSKFGSKNENSGEIQKPVSDKENKYSNPRNWSTQIFVVILHILFTDSLTRILLEQEFSKVSARICELQISLERGISSFSFLLRSYKFCYDYFSNYKKVSAILGTLIHFRYFLRNFLYSSFLIDDGLFDSSKVEDIFLDYKVNGKIISKKNDNDILSTTPNGTTFQNSMNKSSPFLSLFSLNSNIIQNYNPISRVSLNLLSDSSRPYFYSCFLRTSNSAIHEFDSFPHYYFDNDHIILFKLMSYSIPYGFEFLGSFTPLVMTPSVRNAFLTAALSFQSNLAFSIIGPACSGKTEIIKDLTRYSGNPFISLSCLSLLSTLEFTSSIYSLLLKFLKGYATSGCWCLLDDVNVLSNSVLSLIGQQIEEIQSIFSKNISKVVIQGESLNADSKGMLMLTINNPFDNTCKSGYFQCPFFSSKYFMYQQTPYDSFISQDFLLDEKNNVFRRFDEIPSNIKSTFRPYSISHPDFLIIIEVLFFSLGFTASSLLSSILYRIFSYLNSVFDGYKSHYQFNLRLLKIIVYASKDNLFPLNMLTLNDCFFEKREFDSDNDNKTSLNSPNSSLILRNEDNKSHYKLNLLEKDDPDSKRLQVNLFRKEIFSVYEALITILIPMFITPSEISLVYSIINVLFDMNDYSLQLTPNLNQNLRDIADENLLLSLKDASSKHIPIRLDNMVRSSNIPSLLTPKNEQLISPMEENDESSDEDSLFDDKTPADSNYMRKLSPRISVTSNNSLSTTHTPFANFRKPILIDPKVLLQNVVKDVLVEFNLSISSHIIDSCINFNDILMLRNGIVVFGESGSGKSTIIRTLAIAWSTISSEINWEISQALQIQNKIASYIENQDIEEKNKETGENQDYDYDFIGKSPEKNYGNNYVKELLTEREDFGDLNLNENSEKKKTLSNTLKLSEFDKNEEFYFQISVNQEIKNMKDKESLDEISELKRVWIDEKDDSLLALDTRSLLQKEEMKKISTFRSFCKDLKWNLIYPQVFIHALYPSAYSESDFMGFYNPSTNEWHDGLLPKLLREISSLDQGKLSIFEEYVYGTNPITSDISAKFNTKNDFSGTFLRNNICNWISFDSSSLSLLLGEFLKSGIVNQGMVQLPFTGECLVVSPSSKLIFESDTIANTSPSMISRCGILYVGNGKISAENLIESWLSKMKSEFKKEHEISILEKQLIASTQSQNLDCNNTMLNNKTEENTESNKKSNLTFFKEIVCETCGILSSLFDSYIPQILSFLNKECIPIKSKSFKFPCTEQSLISLLLNMLDASLPPVFEEIRRIEIINETEFEDKMNSIEIKFNISQNNADGNLSQEQFNKVATLVRKNRATSSRKKQPKSLALLRKQVAIDDTSLLDNSIYDESNSNGREKEKVDTIFDSPSLFKQISPTKRKLSRLKQKLELPSWMRSSFGKLSSSSIDSLLHENMSSVAVSIFLKRRKRLSEIEINKKKERKKNFHSGVKNENLAKDLFNENDELSSVISLKKKELTVYPPSVAPETEYEKAINSLRKDHQMNINWEKKKFFERIHATFLFCITWSIGSSLTHLAKSSFESVVRTVTGDISNIPIFPGSASIFDLKYNIRNNSWDVWKDVVNLGVNNVLVDRDDILCVDRPLEPGVLHIDSFLQPTIPVVRSLYLLRLLSNSMIPVVICGPPCSGKKMIVNHFLRFLSRDLKFISPYFQETLNNLIKDSSENQEKNKLFSYEKKNQNRNTSAHSFATLSRRQSSGSLNSSRLMKTDVSETKTSSEEDEKNQGSTNPFEKSLSKMPNTLFSTSNISKSTPDDDYFYSDDNSENLGYLIQYPIQISLTPSTTASHLRNFVENHLDVKKDSKISPQEGSRLIVFVNDLEEAMKFDNKSYENCDFSINNSNTENGVPRVKLDFENQSPLEFLRLWVNENGWYQTTRSTSNSFGSVVRVLDTVLITACNIESYSEELLNSNSSFNNISHSNYGVRLFKKLFPIVVDDIDEDFAKQIFSAAILNFVQTDKPIRNASILNSLVEATVAACYSIKKALDESSILPEVVSSRNCSFSSELSLYPYSSLRTSNVYYLTTFNCRSISEVLSGILMCEGNGISKEVELGIYKDKFEKDNIHQVVNDEEVVDTRPIFTLGFVEDKQTLIRDSVKGSFEGQDIPINIIRLWYHEFNRVFSDGFYFKNHVDAVGKHCSSISLSYFNRSPQEKESIFPPIFCDFMKSERFYEEIQSTSLVYEQIQTSLKEYNNETANENCQIDDIIFEEAVNAIIKFCRIFRKTNGNCLIVGRYSSQTKSLVKISSFISDCIFFNLPYFYSELSQNPNDNVEELLSEYVPPGVKWKLEIKKLLKLCGSSKAKPHILFVDDELLCEPLVLEDISYILKDNIIPELFSPKELQDIYKELQPLYYEETRINHPTEFELYKLFLNRIKDNLHIVLCLDPTSEYFDGIVKYYGFLYQYCQSIVLNLWEEKSLKSIARTCFLKAHPFEVPISILDNSRRELEILNNKPNIKDIEISESTILSPIAHKSSEDNEIILSNFINACFELHIQAQQVTQAFSNDFLCLEMRFPLNFLFFLRAIKNVTRKLRTDSIINCNKMRKCVERLAEIEVEIPNIEDRLKVLLPLLEQATKDIEFIMDKIKVESAKLEQTKSQAEEKEIEVKNKSAVAQSNLSHIDAELQKCSPELDAANNALKRLNPKNISEIKRMRNPPLTMTICIEALCIVLNSPPEITKDGKADYWVPARILFNDLNFLKLLQEYDSKSIPDDIVNKLKPYINNPKFTPKAMEKVSAACKNICFWIRSVYSFNQVWRSLSPLLLEQEFQVETLKENEKALEIIHGALDVLERRMKSLSDQKMEIVKKKDQLLKEIDKEKLHLELAKRLFSLLSDKKESWPSSLIEFQKEQSFLTGDSLLCAANIVYSGMLPPGAKSILNDHLWLETLKKYGFICNSLEKILSSVVNETDLSNWSIRNFLPSSLNFNLSAASVMISSSGAEHNGFRLKWPVIIDPHYIALKWLISLHQKDIVIIQPFEKNLKAIVSDALRNSKSIIILTNRYDISISSLVSVSSDESTTNLTNDEEFFLQRMKKRYLKGSCKNENDWYENENDSNSFRLSEFGKKSSLFWFNELKNEKNKNFGNKLFSQNLNILPTVSFEFWDNFSKVNNSIFELLSQNFINDVPPEKSSDKSNIHKHKNTKLINTSSLSQKKTCIFEISPDQLPPIPPSNVRINSNVINVSKQSNIYIITNSEFPFIPPEILNQYNFINFSLCFDSLSELMMCIISDYIFNSREKERKDMIKSINSSKQSMKVEDNMLCEVLVGTSLDNLFEQTIVRQITTLKNNVINAENRILELSENKFSIDQLREKYAVVGSMLSILYLLSSGMKKINPMYNLSLNKFISYLHDSLRLLGSKKNSKELMFNRDIDVLGLTGTADLGKSLSTSSVRPPDNYMTFFDSNIEEELLCHFVDYVNDADIFFGSPKEDIDNSSFVTEFDFENPKIEKDNLFINNVDSIQDKFSKKEKYDEVKLFKSKKSFITGLIEDYRKGFLTSAETNSETETKPPISDSVFLFNNFSDSSFGVFLFTRLISRMVFVRYGNMYKSKEREILMGLFTLYFLFNIKEISKDEFDYTMNLFSSFDICGDFEYLNHILFLSSSSFSYLILEKMINIVPSIKYENLDNNNSQAMPTLKRSWIDDKVWNSLVNLSKMPRFSFLGNYIENSLSEDWISLINSFKPEMEKLPKFKDDKNANITKSKMVRTKSHQVFNNVKKKDSKVLKLTSSLTLSKIYSSFLLLFPSSHHFSLEINKFPLELLDHFTRFLFLVYLHPESSHILLNCLTNSILGNSFVDEQSLPSLDESIRFLPPSIPLIIIPSTNSEDIFSEIKTSVVLSKSSDLKVRKVTLSDGDKSTYTNLIRYITEGTHNGYWIVISNSHHNPSSLDYLCQFIQNTSVISRARQRFRLIIITLPHSSFSRSLLNSSVVFSYELKKTIPSSISSMLTTSSFPQIWNERNEKWKKIALSITHFFSFLLKRNQFGKFSWNVSNIISLNDWMFALNVVERYYHLSSSFFSNNNISYMLRPWSQNPLISKVPSVFGGFLSLLSGNNALSASSGSLKDFYLDSKSIEYRNVELIGEDLPFLFINLILTKPKYINNSILYTDLDDPEKTIDQNQRTGENLSSTLSSKNESQIDSFFYSNLFKTPRLFLIRSISSLRKVIFSLIVSPLMFGEEHDISLVEVLTSSHFSSFIESQRTSSAFSKIKCLRLKPTRIMKSFLHQQTNISDDVNIRNLKYFFDFHSASSNFQSFIQNSVSLSDILKSLKQFEDINLISTFIFQLFTTVNCRNPITANRNFSSLFTMIDCVELLFPPSYSVILNKNTLFYDSINLLKKIILNSEVITNKVSMSIQLFQVSSVINSDPSVLSQTSKINTHPILLLISNIVNNLPVGFDLSNIDTLEELNPFENFITSQSTEKISHLYPFSFLSPSILSSSSSSYHPYGCLSPYFLRFICFEELKSINIIISSFKSLLLRLNELLLSSLSEFFVNYNLDSKQIYKPFIEGSLENTMKNSNPKFSLIDFLPRDYTRYLYSFLASSYLYIQCQFSVFFYVIIFILY
jgi:energy-coupling factor transporter ATP-binding protein EcfA2